MKSKKIRIKINTYIFLNTLFLLFWFTVSGSIAAIPFENIKVGDSYYKDTLFTEGNLVVVTRLRPSSQIVKVQISSGGTFYVHPSELHEIAKLRRSTDRPAIVGAITVNGEDWLVLDSKWYRIPESGFKLDRLPGEAMNSLVQLPAVPFAPVVDGEWKEAGESWRSWAEIELGTRLTETEFIEAARLKRIPFYSTLDREVVLVEAIVNSGAGAYYLIHGVHKNTAILLKNGGLPILKTSKALNLTIKTSRQAVSYLKYFTSALFAGDGSFIVLDPEDPLLPKYVPSQIIVKRFSVSSKAKKGWTIKADILFRDEIYRAKFFVYSNGVVEMQEDQFQQKISIDSFIVVAEARRFYIDHQP